MDPTTPASGPSRVLIWIGWGITSLVAALMVVDGVAKILKPPAIVEGTTALGYPESVIVGIGIAALCSAVLFAIPRTSIVGAILLTAYLGGAVASHVRAGEPFFAAVIFAVVMWIGLLLREPRLRELLPLVSKRN
jgi:DoxX-like family